MEILVQFAMSVHPLEIIVRNLQFSKKAEYYYLQKAPRKVEIIAPNGWGWGSHCSSFARGGGGPTVALSRLVVLAFLQFKMYFSFQTEGGVFTTLFYFVPQFMAAKC